MFLDQWIHHTKMIKTRYNIPSTDKYFQRYRAFKTVLLKSWPGEKSLSSNRTSDVKAGTRICFRLEFMLFYSWSREITLLYVPFCGCRFGMSISESDSEESLTSEDFEISVISDFQLYVEEQSTLSDEVSRGRQQHCCGTLQWRTPILAV